ncbi:MAG: LamG-like jellyroll fold domain-containing protein [Planctomycetota bacterium]
MFNQSSKQILVGIFAALLLMTMPAYAVENFKVSNYGGANQIWFEVEDFDERDPADDSSFALSDEPGAFGRSISSVNGSDGDGMIRYTFDISKAGGAGGTWYFWGRVINPNNNSDFMLVDGHPGDQVPFTMPVSGLVNGQRIFEQSDQGPDWFWAPTAGSAGEEAHTKTLKDGENTMYVISRESGATWDVFMWTDDPDYVPTDADYENATAPAVGAASNPDPPDGATDVPRDVSLSWKPGTYAPAVNAHRVFLSEVFSDVNEGTVGITLSDNSYTPPQRLDFDKTYYWRVDEVNAPPDSAVYGGRVWSFTTEPVAYPISNVTATASSSAANQGPANTVADGSGLTDDLHSTDAQAMWLSDFAGPQPSWIQFEFDKVNVLDEMWVWNANTELEASIGFGFKDVTVEYSVDGAEYVTLGTTHEFARAPGTDGYAHNTTVDFGGLQAKYVRLTANTSWGGFLPQFSLSEVRFLAIPLSAREPHPDSGATDVEIDVILGWRAGREAAEHNVYVSADEQAVIDGTAPVSTVAEASHGPLSLDLGSTYYWRVDEVNDAETPTTWRGNIESFFTQEFLVVDDFESYNDIDDLADPASNRIFEGWPDGYLDAANGALIGNEPANPSYAETAIVHGGAQSMPMFYSNTLGATHSEGTHTFATAQDWSKHGVQTLGLWFYGAAGNTGQLYVKVNGVKVLYDGDAANLAAAAWQPWNIDLTALGVNLQTVTTLAVGIDGNGAAGTLYFDDIRLYAYSRQLVTPVAPDPAGLLAHYPLDGNANDSAGTAHGTVSGGTFVAGRFGQAISLAGIGLAGGEYVDCGNPPQLDFGTGSWTVSAWIKAPSSTDQMNVFSNGGDSSGGIRYVLSVGETSDHMAVLTLDDNASKEQSTGSVVVDDDQWHHIVGIRDGGSMRIYVDGFQDGSDNALPDGYNLSGTSQANAYIGAGWNFETSVVQKFFVGAIDEVRVYNYALSSAEVRSLYGATLPVDEPF